MRTLRVRDPDRFDVLTSGPGEECQVDFGQGALTLYRNGKYRRPWLYVMTLKYSGKAFRKVVWKADQRTWARLHEEVFRSFGGSVEYVVLDNLKQGVIKPDLYAPELNPIFAALLGHYDCTADVCRIEDPDRKGAVENAIKHTQSTALKGRKFESIEEQNAWLTHWEERWAAPRIHGRKKRQVMQMFLEEKPHLRPLPLEGFRFFEQETRKRSRVLRVLGDFLGYDTAGGEGETIRINFESSAILDECHQGRSIGLTLRSMSMSMVGRALGMPIVFSSSAPFKMTPSACFDLEMRYRNRSMAYCWRTC